eukprot:s8517_g1.t1
MASTKASATDGRARAESEAGAGAAGSSAHRPHRPSEPQEPHRSDVARSDKKGSTPAQGQGQRKGTKVDLQKAAPDASAAGQGRHEKLVLTPRHITVGPGDGHGGHGEARTYSAGTASLTATRGSGSGHGESDRSWRHVSEADRGRGHRGERTTAEPDEQMHGKAVKLTGSNAVQRGEAGASSRAELGPGGASEVMSSQGSPAAADKGRVWRGKDRGEASSRGTGQPQRAEDGWDEEIYDYSADQYREPVSARRDEGRPLPPRPPLARPRQVVLKSRSRSPKSFAARDTDRHGARAHGGHKEEADHSYREWPRAVANGAQHFSYEEHRGPGLGTQLQCSSGSGLPGTGSPSTTPGHAGVQEQSFCRVRGSSQGCHVSVGLQLWAVGLALAIMPGDLGVYAAESLSAASAPESAHTALGEMSRQRAGQWREQHGFLNDADFAYAFRSYEDAMAQAGTLPAHLSLGSFCPLN